MEAHREHATRSYTSMTQALGPPEGHIHAHFGHGVGRA